MLPQTDLHLLCRNLAEGTDRVKMQHIADSMRRRMNPHPGKQKEENVPILGGKRVPGMQHKYQETVLIFPAEVRSSCTSVWAVADYKLTRISWKEQFCHTYCTYCFRWAQFTAVGSSQAFSTRDRTLVTEYVRSQPQVSGVLFTGGDPMVMKAATMAEYITPLLPDNGGPPNLETIRIGTKSLAWRPERYLSDPDAGELLSLFARTVDAGLNLTIQAHFTHPRELLDPTTQKAIRAVRSTGAMVRCQAPLMYVLSQLNSTSPLESSPITFTFIATSDINRRHINDHSLTWAEMWRQQTRQGMVPYYMFVERDTGASHYFSVPLASTAQIFAAAYATVSGTARIVRGPCMSTSPGKVCVLGDEMVAGQRVLVLQFLQARDPRWCRRVFFAEYDPDVVWSDQLRPAFGEKEFFFFNARTPVFGNGLMRDLLDSWLWAREVSASSKVLGSGITQRPRRDFVWMIGNMIYPAYEYISKESSACSLIENSGWEPCTGNNLVENVSVEASFIIARNLKVRAPQRASSSTDPVLRRNSLPPVKDHSIRRSSIPEAKKPCLNAFPGRLALRIWQYEGHMGCAIPRESSLTLPAVTTLKYKQLV